MKSKLRRGVGIRLRAGLTCLTVLLGTGAGEALAQAPVRIGVLVQELGRAQSQAIKGLSEELRRLGYRERANLFFETRNVKNNRAALQPAAAELAGKNVSVIFTTGTSATRAAMAAGKDTPIVFVYPGDPRDAGLVSNDGVPSTKIAGVAAYAGETMEKRLVLFKQVVPSLRKILIFYDVNNGISRAGFERAERAARDLGLEVAGYGVKSLDELKTTLGGVSAETGAGIFHIADELVESEPEFFFATARAKKLPTMFNEESWAIAGALAAYGPSYLEMGRQAARLIDRILKGESPQAIALERASKFDLTLNYRTANVIGLRLPEAMLKQAERVIR